MQLPLKNVVGETNLGFVLYGYHISLNRSCQMRVHIRGIRNMNSRNKSDWFPTVVLCHTLPDHSSHYDWLFAISDEINTPLRTYRAILNPLATPIGEMIVVLRIQDHRNKYLHYEGPISNDRGHVVRVGYGQYRLEVSKIIEIKWAIDIPDTREKSTNPHRFQRWMIDTAACEANRLK